MFRGLGVQGFIGVGFRVGVIVVIVSGFRLPYCLVALGAGRRAEQVGISREISCITKVGTYG